VLTSIKISLPFIFCFVFVQQEQFHSIPGIGVKADTLGVFQIAHYTPLFFICTQLPFIVSKTVHRPHFYIARIP